MEHDQLVRRFAYIFKVIGLKLRSSWFLFLFSVTDKSCNTYKTCWTTNTCTPAKINTVNLECIGSASTCPISILCKRPGGGGVLPKKLGRGVRPASQNPYPIYDQNLRFSLPYL